MVSIDVPGALALVLIVFCGTCICCNLVWRYQHRRVIKNRAVYLKTYGLPAYKQHYKMAPDNEVYAAHNDVVLGVDKYTTDLDWEEGEGPNANSSSVVSRLPAIIAV